MDKTLHLEITEDKKKKRKKRRRILRLILLIGLVVFFTQTDTGYFIMEELAQIDEREIKDSASKVFGITLDFLPNIREIIADGLSKLANYL